MEEQHLGNALFKWLWCVKGESEDGSTCTQQGESRYMKDVLEDEWKSSKHIIFERGIQM